MNLDNGTAYKVANALALGTALFLLWGALAMGILGAEGDRADMMYLAVIAIGVVGAIITRLKAAGMERVMTAMAAAQAVVVVIALIIGKQDSPVSSVFEIVWLNGFFIAMFLTSAWLFRYAERERPHADSRTEGLDRGATT